MIPEAHAVWDALEFRMPMLMRNVEPLSEHQMLWIPAPGRKPIAWQLWHIAEVEDNWIRTLMLGQEPRFPLGPALSDAKEYPPKEKLLTYLHEVRAQTRTRLEAMQEADFDRQVTDPDFGAMTVRRLWAGVVTSFAWHAGQAAMTAKLLPDSPIKVWDFTSWEDATRRRRRSITRKPKGEQER